VFKALSLVGSWGAVWLVIGLLVTLASRRPWILLLVAAADGLAEGASDGIKAAVDRPRPTFHPLVAEPHSSSFPSGHAATSFACALVLAWLVPRLALPCVLLAALIAASRVYLGVHYPLDVIGGAALGAVVATALRLLAAARRRSPRAPRAG
jgi:undecaprenyl-diphosphatase